MKVIDLEFFMFFNNNIIYLIMRFFFKYLESEKVINRKSIGIKLIMLMELLCRKVLVFGEISFLKDFIYVKY